MAPNNLNDIVRKMRAGGGSSALASYSGGRGDNNLINERIDERILRLLGLEDIFDIDYGTYKTLLRERLAAARMTKSRIPVEEDELLRREFKRVRGKEGRFKVTKKKITASNVGLKKSNAIVKYQQQGISKSVIKQEEKKEKSDTSIGQNLKNINQSLDKILKAIVSQGQSDNKRREKERVSGERRKAQERESGLEKPLQVAKNLAKKIIAPFQGILDRVFRFIGFTFLGWMLEKFDDIQKWMGQNKEKVTTVTRFLKDWWPTLLGAYVLFATPFGAFVRGTIKMVGFFIPQIVRLMAANPLLAGLTLATIGGIAKIKESERMKPDVDKIQKDIDKTIQSKETPWYQKLGAGFAGQSLNAPGGPKNPIGLPMPGSMYARGGSISNVFSGLVGRRTGTTVGGFGKDTQAFPIQGGGSAVLAPGETVLQVGARERMIRQTGYDPLSFNVGSNANRPVNFTYNGGGVVGMAGGGILGQLGKFLPGTGSVMAPKTMGNSTVAGYQNRLLGMPLGGVRYPRGPGGYGVGYSQPEMRRYEQYNPKKYFANVGGNLPALINRSNVVGDAFANFGKNVQTIKDAARRQEEMMAKMGYKPDGYVNIFGQPVRREAGGPVSGGMLKIGTTFGGAPGTKQSRWLEGSVTGGSKTTQGSASAKLGYGATYEPTSAENAVTNALNSLISGTVNSQKPTMREGLMGSLMADLSSFYSGSPTEKPKVTTPEDRPKSPGKQSTSTIAPGQQPTVSPPGPSEAEKEAYRKDVMDSYTYGPGYYEKPGDAYDPAKVSAAMEARDRDARIADYRHKYGFAKGGRVTTQTGFDIRGGLMGADTQFTPPMALKPGEQLYVVPTQAVPKMNSMVAQLDRNSNPAKNQGNLKRDVGPKITFITLPDKVTSAASKSGGGLKPGKPQLPDFDVIMDSPKRSEVAEALGIIDLV